MITTIKEFKLNESFSGKVIAKNKIHLKQLIEKNIEHFGPTVDLNYIDVSQVTDMDFLFNMSKFDGDISQWDVSNVTSMKAMFQLSSFNGDISRWDVSNVIDFSSMFAAAKRFNQDLSNWDISENAITNSMFDGDKKNVPAWYKK